MFCLATHYKVWIKNVKYTTIMYKLNWKFYRAPLFKESFAVPHRRFQYKHVIHIFNGTTYNWLKRYITLCHDKRLFDSNMAMWCVPLSTKYGASRSEEYLVKLQLQSVCCGGWEGREGRGVILPVIWYTVHHLSVGKINRW